jgi:DNA polymerase elongation subunit (family B)
MKIVFDLETAPFSDEFRKADSKVARIRLAPVPLVACVYFIDTKKYKIYTKETFSELKTILRKSKLVVTFNGENFDFLVLQKYFKIGRRTLTLGKSVDIHAIASKRAGFRVSLDELARLNLDEPKKIKGKSLVTATLKELKEGCKSDVSQTFRLYKLHLKNSLEIPSRSDRSKRYDEFDYMTIGQNMPNTCPECGKMPLTFVDVDDDEDMTEGQMAEYLAGTWGYANCPKCGIVHWNT